MKVVAYLLAGLGLMAFGALGAAFSLSGGPQVTVLENHPESVKTVEFIPDSGAGWEVEKPKSAVESRVLMAAARNEATRFQASAPHAHEAVYQNTRVSAGHRSWADVLGASVGLFIFMAMLVIAALVALRLKLNSEQKGTPSEGEGIQALHRQAQSLADRMEALETILLERGQHGR